MRHDRTSPTMASPREDVLDGDWDPAAHWSTTNVSEAMPGVPTPLSWTLWRPVFERSMRRGFNAIGALEDSQTADPIDPQQRMIGIFRGRVAAKVEFLGAMGDRLPGTSGSDIAEQFMGTLPPTFRSHPTIRRYPAVAAKLPLAALRAPGNVRRVHAQTHTWWTAEIARMPALDLPAATAAWQRAAAQFELTFMSHVIATLTLVQPTFDQLQKLAARSGHPELAGTLISGQGSHAEMAMVDDCWQLSRDAITLEEFLARHGYHGPGEGELSSQVWREDPRPIAALREQYRAKGEHESPEQHRGTLARQAADARRELLSGLTRHERLLATAVLAAADRFTGLRGTGKAAFVQSLDAARASARQIGTHLTQRGEIEHPDDVFYLTAEELTATAPPGDLATRITERRGARAAYQRQTVPSSWHGRPPAPPATQAEPVGDRTGLILRGIGASPGVIEGRIRVITDPGTDDVEPGELLVAETTDPSWAAVMFASAGLIVDIGGQLSHAAVVARELGIPCVMGLGDATRRLVTGDLCAVDGHAGTITLLEPAPSSP